MQAGALAYMPIILRSGGITPPHVADLAMIIGLSKLMSTAVAMSLVHGKVGLTSGSARLEDYRPKSE